MSGSLDLSALSPAQRRLVEARLTAGDPGTAARVPRYPRDPGAPVPLSFGQQRLWFLHQLEPDSPFYNSYACIRLEGPLNLEILRASVNAVVERHEILRTRFHVVNQQPVQVVDLHRPLDFSAVDLTDRPARLREIEARSIALREIRRPFVLHTEWPLRSTMLRLAPADHIFVLVVHHIASDSWSLGLLFRDLAAFYTAFLRGQPPALPPLRIQYADYAIWQREHLQGERLDAHLGYWKRQLAGLPPVIDLPLDRPRPAYQSFRGASVAVSVPEPLTRRLKRLSLESGVTLFMTLLAGLQVLLHRYSGQGTVVVGTPVAGRLSTDVEDLFGFFLNSLALRVDLGDNPTFREVLRRVRETVVNAYEYQELPFEKLVEELRVVRSLSHNPIFQVMFQLHMGRRPNLELPGITSRLLDIEKGTAQFDLTLYLGESDGWLRGWIEYAAELFEPETAARIGRQYLRVLEAMAGEPDQAVGEARLLTTAEEHQVFFTWNRGEDAPLCPPIDSLIEEQARERADAVALEQEGQSVTYGALSRWSTLLAHYLVRQGVQPEDVVALYGERSPAAVVGLLAILKAGAAYLPLDPDLPPERIRFMLDDARVKVLVATADTPQLAAGRLTVVSMRSDRPMIAREPDTRPPVQVTTDNLAYVTYTSGSTGAPKGVLVTHGSVTNYIVHGLAQCALRPDDRVLQFASLSFDVSAEEIFGALLHGATLVLRSPETPGLAPSAFAQDCRLLQVTVLDLPTAYWHQLVVAGAAQLLARYPGLRLVIIGGEQARRDRLEAWYHQVSTLRLVNSYGPAECTIACTVADLTHRPPGGSVPIGRPIPNTEVYVLDPLGQPLPVGVAGELYVGGAGLARGYLRRPDLTAERFVPNPFTQRPGARLYRTGDRARYRPDGSLEFLGRMDAQIKVRGYRIEPGEVEAALREHSAVQEAVAVVWEEGGLSRLVAYLLPRNSASRPGAEEIREAVRRRLPEWMVPDLCIWFEELPRTRSGKIDRAALPPPELSRGERTKAYAPPRTPTEEILAGIWSHLLGIEAGLTDNFFDLGGHSLLATQVVSRVETIFHVELPLRRIFETPTLAAIAVAIDEAVAQAAPVRPRPPLVRLPRERYRLPVSQLRVASHPHPSDK